MSQLKGFRFVTTLVLVFKKIESEDKTIYDNFYSSSKAEIIINESEATVCWYLVHCQTGACSYSTLILARRN